MLKPRNRHVYLEALKPPSGFVLNQAVGTTFSLDLQTLLAIPLGFAMLDWENEKGELSLDPGALLYALRQCADRVTVFCQAGRVAAPTKRHPLFVHLEPIVAEVHAPNENGAFHAKTWLIRFTDNEGSVLYRFICLSRNLTPDRSWDTVLAIDGELADRKRAFSRNHPLGDFIAALPRLKPHGLSQSRRDALALLADEVRRVKFGRPEGVEEVAFWPMGLPRARKFPLAGRVDRLLVVSPFISDGFLGRLADLGPAKLISRPESLDGIPPVTLNRFDDVYVLDDAAEEEDTDETEENGIDEIALADVRGLHAKLFLADQGWKASVWTGSANATKAAFEKNVEFLVQLRGRKSDIGIDAFLGAHREAGGFQDLLRRFEIGERKAVDAEVQANEETVELARRRLSRAGLRLRVEVCKEHGGYDLELYVAGTKSLDLGSAYACCWPITVDLSFAQDLSGLVSSGPVRFPNLTLLALTSFVTFEVSAGDGAKRVAVRFAMNLPLEGAPDDRLDQVLHAMLGDWEKLLRYLLFLLSREEDIAVIGPALFAGSYEGTGGGGPNAGTSFPLFEELVRALARSPDKLDSVWRLVEDLRKTPEGAALLPEGFDEVWEPIWAARVVRKGISE